LCYRCSGFNGTFRTVRLKIVHLKITATGHNMAYSFQHYHCVTQGCDFINRPLAICLVVFN